MSHQPVIDGFEFASAGAAQEGRLSLSAFPRLQDVLVSDSGEVEYRLRGVRDERGRPGLQLDVRGTLSLRCQRCLERLAFEVDAHELLLALPYAPRHEECEAPEGGDEARISPFAALRGMIERKH